MVGWRMPRRVLQRPTSAIWRAALALTALVGCGDPDVTSQSSAPQGECNAVLTRFENGVRDHVGECTGVSYPMSPPVFGEHYPVWAAYQTYDFALPLGYLVHDLEHGAIVLFYDCPDGCADEVAQVQSFIDELPADPRCAPFGIEHQVVLVPRPGLRARWAASAWGYSITADCFDAQLFGEFYAEHVGRGPENLCNQGVVFESNPCE